MQRLSRMGKPVRYWYASEAWDLDWYQTVFAREPGSMEMPSAGRGFSWRMLLDLRKGGIATAFLVLHAGLSSYMDLEFDASHLDLLTAFLPEDRLAAVYTEALGKEYLWHEFGDINLIL